VPQNTDQDDHKQRHGKEDQKRELPRTAQAQRENCGERKKRCREGKRSILVDSHGLSFPVKSRFFDK